MMMDQRADGITNIDSEFLNVVEQIGEIGLFHHRQGLLANAQANAPFVKNTIRSLKNIKTKKVLIISAGPSIHRRNMIRRVKESSFNGLIICVDGVLVSCLREGLIPDFIITLDPHPRRIVRWFGDPRLEENSENDDYFSRQDLDVEFRENQLIRNHENIELVNRWGPKCKILVSTTSPHNVVERIYESKMEAFWWNPLVDNPDEPESLTRQLYKINSVPCLNTGGTIGTAAWVFSATWLKCLEIGMVGVDLGYFEDTPYSKTQTYHELVDRNNSKLNIEKYFMPFTFPLTGEKFYTDPTYFWYRKNFLEVLGLSPSHVKTYNCSEGGTLFSEGLECIYLDDFLRG